MTLKLIPALRVLTGGRNLRGGVGHRRAGIAIGAVLALGLVACGSEPDADSAGDKDGSTSTTVELTSTEKEFCEREAELGTQFVNMQPDEVVEAINELGTLAPEDLADEFEIVAQSYADRTPDGQPKSTAQEYVASIQEAGGAIDAYVAEKCRPAAPPTTDAAESVLDAPKAGASITGKTPCPEVDGSSARTTSFDSAPPTCIDSAKKYVAKFETTKGDFEVTFDAKAAPISVNNFVVLARYHFYDGIPFHRIVPDFVIQAGDPVGDPWGTHGPGYTISEEPPADKKYEKYDMAMAKTSDPNSTGSQFFVVTGSAEPLNQLPTYSLIGSVTGGRDVVDEIGATPTGGAQNDTPSEAVVIEKVTIDES
jgi:cyclophilin family peptidyl-prolyl cis-trans isomerase